MAIFVSVACNTYKIIVALSLREISHCVRSGVKLLVAAGGDYFCCCCCCLCFLGTGDGVVDLCSASEESPPPPRRCINFLGHLRDLFARALAKR